MALSPIAAGFTISIMTARSLGPEGRGGYSLALLIMGTVGFLANPGIYAASNYFASSRRLPGKEVFQTSLALSIPSGSVAFVLALSAYYLTVTTAGSANSVASTSTALIVGIGASAMLLNASMSGLLIGSGLVRLSALVSITSSVLQIVIALVHFVRADQQTVLFYVALFAGTQAIEAVARMTLAGRASWSGYSFRNRQYRAFLRYGVVVYVGRVLFVGAQKVDSFLVFVLIGQVALGYYGISTMLADQLWLVPTAVSMVMMANIARRDTNDAAAVASTASQAVLVASIVSALMLALLGSWLIPVLYGLEFRPSVAPFLVMLPGMIAISTYAILEPFFQSRGMPGIPAQISAIGFLTNLVLCLVLMPRLGIMGAALSYSLSYGIQLASACFAYGRYTKQPITEPVNIIEALKLGRSWLGKKSLAVVRVHPSRPD